MQLSSFLRGNSVLQKFGKPFRFQILQLYDINKRQIQSHSFLINFWNLLNDLESVWKSNLNPILQASPPNAMSVEFFNLIFAFAALVHQYPAVFWRTNHCFAFTFSLLLAILGIQGLLEINATEIIVKLCWNDKNSAPFLAGLCRLAPSEMPETAAEKVDFLAPADFDKPAVDPEGLQNAAALFLSTFGTLVMLMLTACVFDYGIDQFVDRLATLRRSTILRPSSQNIVPSDSASIQGDGVGGVCGLKSEGHRIRQRTIVCRRVVAVIGALCVLAIKTPILIACGRTFEIARQPLLLANIVATIVFFCVWFITWFAFCLKPEWKFKVILFIAQTLCGLESTVSLACLASNLLEYDFVSYAFEKWP